MNIRRAPGWRRLVSTVLPLGGLLLGGLALGATPAAAQDSRFELGRRLRAFEVAWSATPDPTRRAAAIASMGDAVTAFFTLRFRTAARRLDAARLALEAPADPDVAEARRWAAALALTPERHLLDADTAALAVRIDAFYDPQVARPRGASFRLVWLSRDRDRPLASWDGPTPTLPQRVVLRMANAPPPEGDHRLVLEVRSALGVDRVSVGVSVVERLRPRLAALRRATPRGPTASATLRGLRGLLEGLAAGDAPETDLLACDLLRQAEAWARAERDTPLPCGPGDRRIWLAGKRRTLAARAVIPPGSPSDPPPLVVAIHGAGASENMWFDAYGSGALPAACRERGWVFVAPRMGFLDAFRGLPLTDLLDALEGIVGFDRRRVFLVGHSQGAMQALDAAQEAPSGTLAGLVLVSVGGPIERPESFQTLPTLLVAGEDDFSRGGTERLHRALERIGAADAALRILPNTEHLTVVGEAIEAALRHFDRLAPRARPEKRPAGRLF